MHRICSRYRYYRLVNKSCSKSHKYQDKKSGKETRCQKECRRLRGQATSAAVLLDPEDTRLPSGIFYSTSLAEDSVLTLCHLLSYIGRFASKLLTFYLQAALAVVRKSLPKISGPLSGFWPSRYWYKG